MDRLGMSMRCSSPTVCALVWAILLASCGAQTPESSERRIIAAADAPLPSRGAGGQPVTGDAELVRAEQLAPSETDISELRSPLGSWINVVLNNGASESELWSASEARIQACMEARGFRYEVLLAADYFSAEDWTRSIGDIIDDRRSIGYGVADSHLSGPAPERSLDHSEEYLRALGDSGGEGCRAEAEAQVYEPLLGNLPQHQGLFSDFSRAMQDDGGAVRGVEAWRSCMSAKGHTFADPWSVAEEFSRRAAAIDPSDQALLERLLAEEIATSLDDGACLLSDYMPIRDEVEGRILASWVAAGKLPEGSWPVPTS